MAASGLVLAAGSAQAESLPALPPAAPKHHIRFAVCGSHDHIQAMIGAIQRGGSELVAWWGAI